MNFKQRVWNACVRATLGSHDRSWEMLIAVHTNFKCYAWNCITPIPRTCCYWHYSDYRLTDWLTDLLFFTEVFNVWSNLLRFHWRQFQKLSFIEVSFLRNFFEFYISIFERVEMIERDDENRGSKIFYYIIIYHSIFTSHHNISTKGKLKVSSKHFAAKFLFRRIMDGVRRLK